MTKRFLVNVLLALVSLPYVLIGFYWYEKGFSLVIAVSLLALISLTSALIVVMHK